MNYGQPLRILHALLALCMLAQLAVGEMMDVPGAQQAPEQTSLQMITPVYAHGGQHAGNAIVIVEKTLGFQVHEILGLTVAGLLLIRLIMAFTGIPGAGWRGLFPWLSNEGRCALLNESKAQAAGWKQGKLAPPEEGETVARSVHGFMLLTTLGIAAAGIILFFGWNELGRQSDIIGMVGEVHEALVGLLEALLAAHVLAVILHQWQGHDILARIRPGRP